MNEFDDLRKACAVADLLRAQHPERAYTVTSGVNRCYAVRCITSWNDAFLRWRKNYYLTMGWQS
jgi:hypothetical protein